MPQIPMPYARFCGRYMSPILAPPVARTGEPTKPVMKRKARSMPKFTASAVGTCKTTNNAKVPMYIGLRPYGHCCVSITLSTNG